VIILEHENDVSSVSHVWPGEEASSYEAQSDPYGLHTLVMNGQGVC